MPCRLTSCRDMSILVLQRGMQSNAIIHSNTSHKSVIRGSTSSSMSFRALPWQNDGRIWSCGPRFIAPSGAFT